MLEMTIESIRVGLMNPQLTRLNSQYVVMLKEKMAERYLPIFIGPAEANAIAIKLRGETLPRPLTHDLLHSIIDALGASVDSIIVSDLKNDTFYAKINLQLDGGQVILQVEEQSERGYTWVSFLWGAARYRLQVVREWEEPNKRFLEGLREDNNCLFELCHDEKEGVWFITKCEIDARPSDALALAVRVEVPIYAEESVLEKAGISLDRVEESGELAVDEKDSESRYKGRKISDEELRKLSAFSDFIDSLDLEDFGKHKS